MSQDKPKPMRLQSLEVSALNDLLNTMNNPDIAGVFVPPGVDTAAVDRSGYVAPVPPRTGPDEIDKSSILYEPKDLSKDIKKLRAKERADAKRAIALNGPDGVSGPAGVDVPKPIKLVGKKLFFTGRLKSGKDTAATAAGATIFGFADPLYAIATYYFGVTISAAEGKDLPGARMFLQIIGQWGRGVISDAYPLTVARGLLTQQVRRAGAFGFPEVDWASYGSNPDIWLDACIKRADQFLVENPAATVAITNCRFDNEFKRLQSVGWSHWHCLCSPKTWSDRLALSKLTPESPSVKDTSEQLAASLDANVTRQLSAAKQGPKLRCIWSDKNVPAPSDRLHTVDSFLQSLKGAA